MRTRTLGELRTFRGAPVYTALTGIMLSDSDADAISTEELEELVSHLACRSILWLELASERTHRNVRQELIRQFPQLDAIPQLRDNVGKLRANEILLGCIALCGNEFAVRSVGLMLHTDMPSRIYADAH